MFIDIELNLLMNMDVYLLIFSERMEPIKDWFSCQLASKSSLSTRFLSGNFFSKEPLGEESRDQGSLELSFSAEYYGFTSSLAKFSLSLSLCLSIYIDI